MTEEGEVDRGRGSGLRLERLERLELERVNLDLWRNSDSSRGNDTPSGQDPTSNQTPCLLHSLQPLGHAVNEDNNNAWFTELWGN